MTIEELRKKIDEIDVEIVKLLRERVALVKRILALKSEKSLPVTDYNRENEIMARLLGGDKEVNALIRKVYEEIFRWAKELKDS